MQLIKVYFNICIEATMKSDDNLETAIIIAKSPKKGNLWNKSIALIQC